MQKITPFLWFDNNGEEAINFYISVFKNGKVVGDIRRNPDGKLFTATFEIEGQQFMILNGGPYFKFNEAVSFFVRCETQEEVNELWQKLTEGGKESQCGWLKDKYGLSWQIIPVLLEKLLTGSDAAGRERAMQAMLKMSKIESSVLQKAYNGQ